MGYRPSSRFRRSYARYNFVSVAFQENEQTLIVELKNYGDIMTEAEKRLEESYNHIKRYLNKENTGSSIKLLHEMCNSCEVYCGKEHDYEECRNKPCFKLFLGYEWMEWYSSWS